MTYDLIIKNATCALTDKNGRISFEKTDVGILNSKIANIQTGLADESSSTTIVDARGLHCLPGVIDSQVHFREPGLTHKEDFESGTRSALLGGVTSVFEMPNTMPPTRTTEDFLDKVKRMQNRAWVNMAFFGGAATDNLEQLSLMENLEGCSGIKIFMGSSTGTLLVEDDDNLEKILQQCRRRVIVHSEDEYRLRERKQIALDAKHARVHHIWRDAETALSSTKRLLALARKLNHLVHVLHITTADEIEVLKQNRDIASVEVLPQHLTLSAPECYERLGSLAQQNPPIREKNHQDALWKALREGFIDVIGSDHAPHTLEEKSREYPSSPSGVPGVQTLIPIMLDHVNKQNLSLEKFVQLVCENPRWVFGCKTKGRISVGMDADLTLIDLKKQETISNKWIASRAGWTPFDNMKVTGWPVGTIIGGEIKMREGEILGTPTGKMVHFES